MMPTKIIATVIGSMLAMGIGHAVMFWQTADPAHNTGTPGDNSGWQYEGTMDGYLGVPIAPHFFLSAKHIAEHNVGDVFYFHGDAYTTIAAHNSPNTDLRIWEVAHAKPFPTYAPLSTGANDVGAVATIHGRGYQRGVAVVQNNVLKGWRWGTPDGLQRWGRNEVTGSFDAGGSYGEVMYCHFNHNGVTHECHLSVGDSGGGIFVLENGLWRLAGINLAVDGPFRKNASEGGGSMAALFDVGGMEYFDGSNWVLESDTVDDKPSSFYASRVAASLTWINNTATGSSTLAMENFSAWQKLYFTPAQIANANLSGMAADYDQDGIVHLLEYAFHLEPIFNERKTLEASTGIRGMPMIRKESIGNEERLSIEFLRRKNSNGAALTYVHEFSPDLVSWQTVGTVDVTSINDRWERVKVTDAVTRAQSARRFARVRVSINE